jgi:hypothetical protein
MLYNQAHLEVHASHQVQPIIAPLLSSAPQNKSTWSASAERPTFDFAPRGLDLCNVIEACLKEGSLYT